MMLEDNMILVSNAKTVYEAYLKDLDKKSKVNALLYKSILQKDMPYYKPDTIMVKIIKRDYDKDFPLGIGFEFYNSLKQSASEAEIRRNNTVFYDWYMQIEKNDLIGLQDNLKELKQFCLNNKLIFEPIAKDDLYKIIIEAKTAEEILEYLNNNTKRKQQWANS